MDMVTLSAAEEGSWQLIDTAPRDQFYRLCVNYLDHAVCNWAVPMEQRDFLCQSCALTRIIPDLSIVGNREAWAKLEMAKRRLVYAVLSLELPMRSKAQDPERGLEFRFMSDSVSKNGDKSRVLTGHDNGLITINVAEADDVHREIQRQQHHEPYRTVLGHFRHEIGHYYWDRLIQGSEELERFRALFGDERTDYQAALNKHYAAGPPADWAERFISTYASTHPWEDWAESWAHVMHMVDSLETAYAVGLAVQPARRDEPALTVPAKPPQARISAFDQLISEWKSLTYVLNNLTRGLGLADAYPFVLCEPVIDKLRFVCHTMGVAKIAI